ncbi:MAG: hypothetical protein ACOYXY_13115, partial [Thermodesulfobacteriota bacterium]
MATDDDCHCERSDAISALKGIDCFVVSLLAMTRKDKLARVTESVLGTCKAVAANYVLAYNAVLYPIGPCDGRVASGEQMKKLLERYLKVYSHEFSNFAWLAAIFFVIFFVTAIFRTYVDAAFLKRYGPQYIPMMLVINAILTFVVLGVVDRLSRRYLDHFLLSGFLGCLGVMVIILFWMVKSGFSIAYPILYQLLYLLDSILLLYLWNMAGDLFDTRQGKRIFPLVTMSQVLGTTIGSFITKPIT